MSDKKNIDRLFQEKFKDFEVTPNDAVWKKIQARKNKDRKRIVLIPFWYRIAGVAALIAVILSVGSILLPENKSLDTIVVTEDSENTDNLSIEKEDNTTIISDDGLVDTPKKPESNHSDGTSESTNTNNEAITNNSIKNKDKDDTPLDITADPKSTISSAYKKPSSNKKNADKNGIVISNTEDNEIIISTNGYQKKDDALLEQKTATKNAVSNATETDKEKTSFIDQEIVAKSSITEKTPSVNDNKEETSVKENDSYTRNSDDIDTKKEGIANKEKSASDKTLDQNEDIGKKSIFDAIKEKEEKEIAVAEVTSGKKWNISPNVAPVYYDSFGGSSIDQEFSDNNKQGQVNLSYGIQVAYSINDRLSVRSGVNKVDVGYNTEDVGFGIASVAREIPGSNNATNVQNIIISDFQGTSPSFSPAPDINDEILVKSQNPALLNHSIGYIEVPLELKYSLTDSKIGIHMIGGVSTLFLEDDEVSIIAGSFRNENVVREETVNDISFSGNIGIGFDYKLSDQFKINMEPIFKYQFNGFKESAENFKPYYFGVYTGISFRF
ncbi:outer membrane beta-barrel protein [uncultured Aquimarina sp.]|uniref:outer membrane beta-barrel protein n=1 Tax=uncultured Aquimarina sp. TaxID=575652 RepID=UPI00262E1273|nr:outer membrane beta-barrel protein [uncultured Aquimarina sp.]